MPPFERPEKQVLNAEPVQHLPYIEVMYSSRSGRIRGLHEGEFARQGLTHELAPGLAPALGAPVQRVPLRLRHLERDAHQLPAVERGPALRAHDPLSWGPRALPALGLVDLHPAPVARVEHGRRREHVVEARLEQVPDWHVLAVADAARDLATAFRLRVRCAGPWATGRRNGSKPGIMRTKRRKPPRYRGGTKTMPYQLPGQYSCLVSSNDLKPQ